MLSMFIYLSMVDISDLSKTQVIFPFYSIYMIDISGQTARQNWLNNFVGAHWHPGG